MQEKDGEETYDGGANLDKTDPYKRVVDGERSPSHNFGKFWSTDQKLGFQLQLDRIPDGVVEYSEFAQFYGYCTSDNKNYSRDGTRGRPIQYVLTHVIHFD